MIGMALGVATLLLALGVMRGFESVVTDKIIAFVGIEGHPGWIYYR